MRHPLIALALSGLLAQAAVAAPMPSVASGEARTREAALQSALRHAVEQVVGMSLGTDTLVTNLKQIQDKVYTQASGYIEGYDVLDETRLPDGSYRVTVNARVTKQKLEDAVRPLVGGSGVELDGKTLLANFQLSLGNQKSYEKQLKGFLDELLVGGFTFTFDYKVDSSLSSPGYILVEFTNFTAEFTPDWYNRYRAFHKELISKPFAKETLSHGATYVTPHHGGTTGTQVMVEAVDEEGTAFDVGGLTRQLETARSGIFRLTPLSGLMPEVPVIYSSFKVKVPVNVFERTKKLVVRAPDFAIGRGYGGGTPQPAWPVKLD